jgi:hypothetical protein
MIPRGPASATLSGLLAASRPAPGRNDAEIRSRAVVTYRTALVGLAAYRLHVKQRNRTFHPMYALRWMRTRRQRPELALRDLADATLRGLMYAGANTRLREAPPRRRARTTPRTARGHDLVLSSASML